MIANFIINNAKTIAQMVNSHGPAPPTLTGDAGRDRSLGDAWISQVALLAEGHEPTAHNGSTYQARKEAATTLVAAYGADTSESRILRHKTLPVEADEECWAAMGWQTYSNSPVVGARKLYDHGVSDELLAVAVAEGLTGPKALAYVVKELRRIKEEEHRNRARTSEANAVSTLAAAISTTSEQDTVSKLMSHLSEKTQYALRQQLAGTGLIPH